MDRPDPYGPLAGAGYAAIDQREGDGTAERRAEQGERERAEAQAKVLAEKINAAINRGRA